MLLRYLIRVRCKEKPNSNGLEMTGMSENCGHPVFDLQSFDSPSPCIETFHPSERWPALPSLAEWEFWVRSSCTRTEANGDQAERWQ